MTSSVEVAVPAHEREAFAGTVRRAAAGPVARFVAIGILSTLAHALLFLILRGALAAGAANALALALTAVANTAANRRFTFGVRGREAAVRHQLQGLAVFALALAMTSGALALTHAIDPHAARAVEVAVLVGANLCATVMRYLALRWIFSRRNARPAVSA
jgi:putative flippase GtrA